MCKLVNAYNADARKAEDHLNFMVKNRNRLKENKEIQNIRLILEPEEARVQMVRQPHQAPLG